MNGGTENMSYIIGSGESSEGIILENDFMTVADGGTATETTVENGGSNGHEIVFKDNPFAGLAALNDV